MGKKDVTKPGELYIVWDKREPGRVRYVGRTVLGVAVRAQKHWYDCKTLTTAFPNWLRSRLDRKDDVVFEPVSWHPNVPALNEAEVALIAHYRTLGQADLNLTDGGDGGTGAIWTDERVEKHRRNVRRGDSHPHARLTRCEADEIRTLRKREYVGLEELSAMYSVSRGTIQDILKNRTWYDPDFDPGEVIPVPRSGDEARNRKISARQVKEIRDFRTVKWEPNRITAARYGVTQDMIHRVLRNKNWYDPDFNPGVIKKRGDK